MKGDETPVTMDALDPLEQLTPVDREAQAWVARFAAGKATEGDIRALKRWHERSPAHAEAFAKASQLWETVGMAGRNVARRPAMAIRPDPSSTARFGRRAFLSGALAGAAAAVGYLVVRPPFGLWPSISEFSADYRTKTAEQKHLALADGVSVQMSAQTSITIHPTSDSNATHIELIAGEAMVTAGMTTKPFVLTAGNGRTIAQAASVDIRYVDSNVCVTCIDGEVRVEQGSAAASLQSGQQLIYSAQALSSVRTVDPVAVTAWREGILVFHETPLAEAIEEINRYRPGRIVVVNDALGARLFNARFRIENIDEVVDQVRQVFDARVTSLPGGIVLLG